MTVEDGRAPTPGQTIGPFFGHALPFEQGNLLVPLAHRDAIRLSGRVLDGAGGPVPDAMIELWQVGPDGAVSQKAGSLHRDGHTFTGWGRAATDNAGAYWFSTLRPGSKVGDRLPYFGITVFARGLLDRLFTRAYLPADQKAYEADSFLSAVPPQRRETLIAARAGTDLRFDIHLQGPAETVFLRYRGESSDE